MGDNDWIDLAQDRDGWRAVVNAAVKVRVDKIREISWLAEDLLPSRKDIAPCCYLIR